jgi:NDP-sugar pyrophosphorylase family protein
MNTHPLPTTETLTAPLPEVLIMAGGEGRRLGALTTRTPKPMLPVAGRPVLQHILEQLRDQGIRHAYLSVRHLSHVICGYFGDGSWLGIDIDYLVEDQPLGTAGSIARVPASSRPLLVLNGDIVTLVPVAAMVAQHHRLGAAMTVGSVQDRVSVPYGVIECDGPHVVRVQEKPDLVFTVMAGVYLIGPPVAAAVPRDAPLAMPDLVAAVAATGRVVAFPLPGPWLDIGTPDQYARADEVAAFSALLLPQPVPATDVAAQLSTTVDPALSALRMPR